MRIFKGKEAPVELQRKMATVRTQGSYCRQLAIGSKYQDAVEDVLIDIIDAQEAMGIGAVALARIKTHDLDGFRGTGESLDEALSNLTEFIIPMLNSYVEKDFPKVIKYLKSAMGRIAVARTLLLMQG